jgi:hypothetical protein
VSSPRIEVLDVALTADDPRLLDCGIDAPKPGGPAGPPGLEPLAWDFEVRGYVLGGELAAVAVELVQNGMCIRHAPLGAERDDVATRHPEVAAAKTSGFHNRISALALGREFDVEVKAVLSDESRVPIGAIRGRRAPLRTGYEADLQPLILTTGARTGSTVMMRLLAAHPGIAAYPPFQHEPRVASYWGQVLRVLADPASYLRQISPLGTLNDDWWLGRRHPQPNRIRNRALQDWLGSDGVEALAAFCQSRIDSAYGRIAAEYDRPDAVYFAEKYRPDEIPALMWELYPGAREVFLIRDFRDMVSSIIAVNRKRAVQELRAGPVGYVQNSVRGTVDLLLRAWRQRSDRAHLVRYEDLMRQPGETLEALLVYLGLDSTGEAIEAMRASVAETIPEMDVHRTTPTPESSIGRWREDLTPELKEVCHEALGPALEAFGYGN